tara:strand:+ start:132 stop:497 length:366 start_codon:yes stop_codon:yes gene_type:complete
MSLDVSYKMDAVIWYANQTDPIQKYTARVSDEGVFSFTWSETNSVTKPTDEQITAKATEIQAGVPLMMLRKHRDQKLAETDWMANSDVTLSDAWKKYRQDLRDMPANTADPSNPTWPTKPS